MRNRFILVFLFFIVVVTSCTTLDGTGAVTAEFEKNGIAYTIRIKDSYGDNGMTLHDDTDQISCPLGQEFDLRLDFILSGGGLGNYDFTYTAEEVCFMGQAGIDAITAYRYEVPVTPDQ